MKKRLLSIFNKNPGKLLRQKEIFHKMKVKQHEIAGVKSLLNEWVQSGEIVQVKGKRYTLPREQNQFEGRLTVTQKGFGFVITDDDSEDIFIGRRSMADAIHGDHVRVKLQGRPSPQGLKGRIQKVLVRGSDSFIGVTYKYMGKLFMTISPVNPGRGIRLIKAKKRFGRRANSKSTRQRLGILGRTHHCRIANRYWEGGRPGKRYENDSE